MIALIRRHVLVALCSAAPLALPEAVEAAPPRAPRAPAPPEAPEAPEAPEPPQPLIQMAGFDFAPGRARLGVHVSSMTPELRKFLGAKQDAGILVQRVDPDTPAAKAGIRVGDIVVSVDGDAIDEIDDVASALADHGAGEKVEVVVVRKKARKRLRIAMQDDASARGFAMPEGVFSFGHGAGQEIEILRKTIDALEKRVDELDRSRRRASKPKD